MDTHRKAEWERFLTDNDLRTLWSVSHDIEQVKYAPIIKQLEAEDLRREPLEKQIVLEKKWCVRRFSGTRTQRCQEYLSNIYLAASRVQNASFLRRRRTGNGAYQKEVIRHGAAGNRLHKIMKIRLGNFGDENARDLPVATTIENSRYYLGHSGGDYVFRYQPEIESSPSTSILTSDSTFPDLSRHPSWQSFLNNNDVSKQNFIYCGLVPRAFREYKARFELLCGEVIQLLGSIIVFHDRLSTVDIRSQLASYATTKITCSFLFELYKKWKEESSNNKWDRKWAQGQIGQHPKILECVHLMAKIYDFNHDFLKGMAPLILMIEDAAGKNFVTLLDVYEKCVAQEAFHELLRARNVDHCMVFIDNKGTNVHEFFRDSIFESDPLHPLNRFDHIDVGPALENLAALLNSDESADSNIDSSDSELSDTPDTEAELGDDQVEDTSAHLEGDKLVSDAEEDEADENEIKGDAEEEEEEDDDDDDDDWQPPQNRKPKRTVKRPAPLPRLSTSRRSSKRRKR
ncbi:hypothetical protein QQS21_002956 [Conoideocrella luteorostrata]|uniref:Uncharacterized protein n=1 Tax=Conoideocrella luteorostrata TaxID=1105319 RepID=A0AAJ0G0Y2_9HYPO|nr:hypothetical protein QQS21_002956 [Conoideocrella luteorostrata]